MKFKMTNAVIAADRLCQGFERSNTSIWVRFRVRSGSRSGGNLQPFEHKNTPIEA
jgi:hypothetical protein